MRLVVEDLEIARGGRTVLTGCSFALEAGQAIRLIGPNGSGKSTLLRALAGLLSPEKGAMRLEDDSHSEAPHLPEHLHYTGHMDALKPAMTVAETLAFWQSWLGHPAATPAQALETLGIGHLLHVRCAILSQGQRRRVALARLLVSQRPLWLLDEPTAALDKAGEAQLTSLMAEHRKQGGMIIAATHMPLALDDALTLDLGGQA